MAISVKAEEKDSYSNESNVSTQERWSLMSQQDKSTQHNAG